MKDNKKSEEVNKQPISKQPINAGNVDPKKKLKKEKVVKDEQTKKDDTKKMYAYLGIAFFSLMMFVPTIIRTLDPEYDPEGPAKEVEVVVKLQQMKCEKTTARENYTLVESIVSNYEDGFAINTNINYKYLPNVGSNNQIDIDKLEEDMSEFNKISAIKKDGITTSDDTANEYVVYLDYKKNPELKSDETLTVHARKLDIQSDNYKELGYSCSSVDTGEIKKTVIK